MADEKSAMQPTRNPSAAERGRYLLIRKARVQQNKCPIALLPPLGVLVTALGVNRHEGRSKEIGLLL